MNIELVTVVTKASPVQWTEISTYRIYKENEMQIRSDMLAKKKNEKLRNWKFYLHKNWVCQNAVLKRAG